MRAVGIKSADLDAGIFFERQPDGTVERERLGARGAERRGKREDEQAHAARRPTAEEGSGRFRRDGAGGGGRTFFHAGGRARRVT